MNCPRYEHHQNDVLSSTDDSQEQLYAGQVQYDRSDVNANNKSAQDGHRSTDIPESILRLFRQQPLITLREFHNHLPRRSTKRGRVIGLNKIRDYARL